MRFRRFGPPRIRAWLTNAKSTLERAARRRFPRVEVGPSGRRPVRQTLAGIGSDETALARLQREEEEKEEEELFCAPRRVAQEEDGLAVVTLPYLHFTKPRYGKVFVNSILSQNV